MHCAAICRHVSNMTNPPEGDPFPADEKDVIKRGLDLRFRPTNVDGVSLELLVRHLRAAKAARADRDESVTIVTTAI